MTTQHTPAHCPNCTAAPRLLEALEACLPVLEACAEGIDPGDFEAELQTAYAALAGARGEEG